VEWIFEPSAWVALATLTALELVLGIDNIIFISILAGRLPREQQDKARRTGLLLAMGMRILLLLSLAWMARLTAPLFSVFGHDISGRDLVLIVGGLFLLAKSTHEIHVKLEGEEHGTATGPATTMARVLIQIAILDLVFSLDSVITAVGMVDQIPVMVTAIVISIGLMMLFAKPVGEFVDAHPTVKMLALSFLLLVGMALLADGAGFHIPKGYIYFSMGFSIFVEMLNLRMRARRAPPVRLRSQY